MAAGKAERSEGAGCLWGLGVVKWALCGVLGLYLKKKIFEKKIGTRRA